MNTQHTREECLTFSSWNSRRRKATTYARFRSMGETMKINERSAMSTMKTSVSRVLFAWNRSITNNQSTAKSTNAMPT